MRNRERGEDIREMVEERLKEMQEQEKYEERGKSRDKKYKKEMTVWLKCFGRRLQGNEVKIIAWFRYENEKTAPVLKKDNLDVVIEKIEIQKSYMGGIK